MASVMVAFSWPSDHFARGPTEPPAQQTGLSLHSGLDMGSRDMLSPSSNGRRQLVTFCHMLVEKMSSQIGDGFDADAFDEVGCTDKASQIGPHSFSNLWGL